MKNNTHITRYLQVLAFVAVYIGLGFAFKLDPRAYILIGIPLMLIFHVGIKRKPFYTLWVRDGENFYLGKSGWFIAALLAIYPCYKLVRLILKPEWELLSLGYMLAAILGSVAAGYSFSRFTKNTFRQFFLCLAIAGTIGTGYIALISFAQYTTKGVPFNPDIIKGLKSLLLYIPICFALEEVIFRGVLDATVHQPDEKNGIWSAFFISILWGLWHLPVMPANDAPFAVRILGLIFLHSIVGIPLSLFWRRSGNLAVPGFTHSFIDAVRNALLKSY